MKYLLIAVVLLFVLGIGGFFYLGQQSQSGVAPGLVDGRLIPCPESPNCASSEAGTVAEKQVDSFPIDVWPRLPAMIVDLGGVVTREEADYLAAEFTSSTFSFVDDVEFRLGEDAVHVRSASRVGHSDGGVNGARVAALRNGLGR